MIGTLRVKLFYFVGFSQFCLNKLIKSCSKTEILNESLVLSPQWGPAFKIYTNVRWNKNTHFPEMVKQKRGDSDLAAPHGAI